MDSVKKFFLEKEAWKSFEKHTKQYTQSSETPEDKGTVSSKQQTKPVTEKQFKKQVVPSEEKAFQRVKNMYEN